MGPNEIHKQKLLNSLQAKLSNLALIGQTDRYSRRHYQKKILCEAVTAVLLDLAARNQLCCIDIDRLPQLVARALVEVGVEYGRK